MDKTTIQKQYRPNVAAVILSSIYPKECQFFIAHRTDIKDAWQFPQGGIDEGESPKSALLRELREEIGTDCVEIISACPKWISYDFPSSVAKNHYKGYDGQIQKYFLVRLKNNALINIKTQKPEFDKYEFVDYEQLFARVTHFKKDVYRKVLGYFRKEGYI